MYQCDKMEIAKKILAIVLIILGSIVILGTVSASINPTGPEAQDTSFLIGFYIGLTLIAGLGVALILVGARILKKLKHRRLKKDLLDSLPGDNGDNNIADFKRK